MNIYERFLQLFKPRENIIGVTKLNNNPVPGEKMQVDSRTDSRAPEVFDIERHINGDVSIGLSPLMQSNKCRWACIDIDNYSFDLNAFSKKYKKLPFFPCRTKSGGVHIYMFFGREIAAKKVRLFLFELQHLLYLYNEEVYPKQEKAGESDSANWLNMPYYNSEATDRYCVYQGIKLSLDQFVAQAEKTKIQNFDDVLKNFMLAAAPPCIEYIFSKGIEEGERDLSLFAAATFLKKKYPDNWIEKLEKLNNKLDDPLPDKELQQQIIKTHKKKDYHYKCKEDLQKYCNKEICQYRKYGYLFDDSPEKVIGEIKKLKTDPPVWFVQIIGYEKEIDMSTEDLLNQYKFRLRVLEAINKVIPLVNRQTWEGIISDRLEDLKEIEAPEDASSEMQLYHLIEKYCRELSNTKVLSDVEHGRVYIDEGYNLFRGIGLMDYLKKKGIQNVKANILYSKLRKIGGENIQKMYGAKRLRLWRVPLFDSQVSPVKRSGLDIKDFKIEGEV